jgi:hypothetical protein
MVESHPMPSLIRAAVGAAVAALALPAAAAAAPPPNDNYLSSTSISDAQRPLGREFSDTIDTTEATTQPDMFQPDKDGLPLGGGDPEPTTCGATSYGRTAWWDFRPQSAGGVEISASGGFDVVVAVYEWSSSTSRITRRLSCQNDAPGSETVLMPKVRKGHNYTVQVGGAGNTGGPLKFDLSYFRDRDADGVLDDEPDKCLSRPGIRRFGGCPPELRAAARLSLATNGGGGKVTALTVDDVPKTGRVEVRCGHCGRKVAKKARRTGTVAVDRFVGRFVRAGDFIEVRVTMPKRAKKGRYKYGAVGKLYRYPITGDGIGKRTLRCLNPGSRKPVKCS